jgi:hypothetical protein
MSDKRKQVDSLAGRIKASQPHLSHRQVMDRARETVRKIEKKKG